MVPGRLVLRALLSLTAIPLMAAMAGCSGNIQAAEIINPDILMAREQAAMARQTSLKASFRWSEDPLPVGHYQASGVSRFQMPDRTDGEVVEFDADSRVVHKFVEIGQTRWDAGSRLPSGTLAYQKTSVPMSHIRVLAPVSPWIALRHSPFLRVSVVSCGPGRCYLLTDTLPWVSGGRFAANRGHFITGDSVLIDKSTMLLADWDSIKVSGPGPSITTLTIRYFDYGVPNVIVPPTSG